MAILQGPIRAEKAPEGGRTPIAGTPVELNVETALIEDGARVVGRDLRTIRLRERTGVTLVGIVRADEKITNPGPRERLMSGDLVFLLGDPDQIRAVRVLLSARENTSETTAKEAKNT